MNSFLGTSGLTYLWGKIKDAVSVKADKIQEINHGTSDTTFTLTPNVMHIWGTVSSLNLSLPTDTNSVLDEYLFTFTCPSGGTTLTLPASIVWIQDPEFEEGKTYQISIVNNLAGYLTNGMVAGSTGTESDPIFKASPAYGIASTDITNWNGKQAALISGTNIKTINNESLLGSGNISISGGSGGEENVIETVKVNGTALTPDANKAVDVPVPTETTVSNWGFTKNTGTYSKPSDGIPPTDLASSVQTSLGKADTALQGYTETDPVFTASAAHGITSTDISNWNNKVSNVQADWNATSGAAQILNKPTDLVNNTSLASALDDYLPLAGGTMETTDKITNLNADLLDGYEATDISRLGWVTITNANATSGTGCNWYMLKDLQNNYGLTIYDIISRRSAYPYISYHRLMLYKSSSTTYAVSLINLGFNYKYSNNVRICVAMDTEYHVYIQSGSLSGANYLSVRPIFGAGEIYTTPIGAAAFGTADGFTALKMVTNSGYFRIDTSASTQSTAYDGNPVFLTGIDGAVTVYSGSSAPSSSTGKDGDIYIQTS